VGFFILPKKERKEIIIMTKQEREIILEQINHLAKSNNKIMNTLDNDLFFFTSHTYDDGNKTKCSRNKKFV
jgi:hypothetical protein